MASPESGDGHAFLPHEARLQDAPPAAARTGDGTNWTVVLPPVATVVVVAVVTVAVVIVAGSSGSSSSNSSCSAECF